jgi:hypothetical protein
MKQSTIINKKKTGNLLNMKTVMKKTGPINAETRTKMKKSIDVETNLNRNMQMTMNMNTTLPVEG